MEIKYNLRDRQSSLPGWYKAVLAPLIPYLTVPVGLYGLQNAWAAMFGYHMGMIVIMFLGGFRLEKRMFLGKYPGISLLMLCFGLAGGVLMYVLWPYLDVPAGMADYLHSVGLNSSNFPFFLAYFASAGAFLEEIYWRRFLGSTSVKPVPADILFAGYHVIVLAGKMALYWLPVVVCLLTAGAWLWRQTNRLDGGIRSSLISHITADAAIMLAVFLWVWG
ncbi:MAG TPA: hypothetical protein VLH15_08095 [Dehalococcoidales bacterium]|nr:hypothetical protein [Dehalococcoidales bacterium]